MSSPLTDEQLMSEPPDPIPIMATHKAVKVGGRDYGYGPEEDFTACAMCSDNAYAVAHPCTTYRLAAEVRRQREVIASVRALAERLERAETGWRGYLYMASRDTPYATARQIRTALREAR
jgi:hypothetical protein